MTGLEIERELEIDQREILAAAARQRGLCTLAVAQQGLRLGDRGL
jgi:hypothetical protein